MNFWQENDLQSQVICLTALVGHLWRLQEHIALQNNLLLLLSNSKELAASIMLLV